MKEYGYMEGAYLRSRFIEPIEYSYTDGEGVQHTKIMTEDEQIAQLSPEWKPVDEIDRGKMENPRDGYIVVAVPHDFGDHIGYNYETKIDLQKVRKEIEELKESLTESDFKIVKCCEASFVGEAMPYDVNVLHQERNKQRKRINDLEKFLAINSV